MAEFWEEEPVLAAELQQVKATIEDTVVAANPFVRNVLLEYVRTNGKMLRPALVLMMSSLTNKEIDDDVIKTAAAVELIHLASLVHDDIIDGAPTRRGKQTLFASLGVKQAVLAGDLLLSKALSLTSRLDAETNRVAMANAMVRLCESELEQDADVGNFFITQATYIRRIAGKTASLFALSCYLGAALASEDPILRLRAHRLGYALGMAFQIQDDNLDYDGHAKRLGKEVAKDVKNGIPTLPLLLALKAEKSAGSSILRAHLYEPKLPLSKKKVEAILNLVIQYRGIEEAQGIEQRYHQRIQDDIARLGNPNVEGQLHRLIIRLSKREA